MLTFIQKDDYEVTQIEDEWLVLNAEAFTVTRLNELGGFCLNLLKNEQSIHSLIESIGKEFPHISNLNVEDIESFLEELIKYGLVTHAI